MDITMEQWAFSRWAADSGLHYRDHAIAELGWMARNAECETYRARIAELQATLDAVPKRSGVRKVGDDAIFADIRAAFVDKDGTITRTLNGAPMLPGTDLYVLGDIIE